MKRECLYCGGSIHACMGFVLARDFLRLLQGEGEIKVREICGRCAMLVDIGRIKLPLV